MTRQAFLRSAIVMVLAGLLISFSGVAWTAEPPIDPDHDYAITYEVSAFEVHTVRPAKIGCNPIGRASGQCCA